MMFLKENLFLRMKSVERLEFVILQNVSLIYIRRAMFVECSTVLENGSANTNLISVNPVLRI